MTATYKTEPKNTYQREIAKRLNYWLEGLAPWHRKGAVVHLGRYEKPPAPAWYELLTGDVHIDLNAVKLDSKDESALAHRLVEDPGVPAARTRREVETAVAKIVGLLQHEAAHSKWSTWQPPRNTSKIVADIMFMFEEIRVERRGVDTLNPYVVRGLRSSLSIITENATTDADALRNPLSAAKMWALIRGRVNAGVALPEEVEEIDNAVRTALGDDTVDHLIDLLDEAIDLDADRLYGLNRLREVATEWLELLTPPKPEEEEEKEESGDGEGEGGSESDDESDGDSESDGDDDGDEAGEDWSESGTDDEDATKTATATVAAAEARRRRRH